MRRFQTEKQGRFSRSLALSVLVLSCIGAVFLYGISSMSGMTDRTQKKTLEQAIQRSIVLCYAVEGSYPENLAYLKEHYGLRYDEEKYFVGYEVLGANLMPSVTIIEKE